MDKNKIITWFMILAFTLTILGGAFSCLQNWFGSSICYNFSTMFLWLIMTIECYKSTTKK